MTNPKYERGTEKDLLTLEEQEEMLKSMGLLDVSL